MHENRLTDHVKIVIYNINIIWLPYLQIIMLFKDSHEHKEIKNNQTKELTSLEVNANHTLFE